MDYFISLQRKLCFGGRRKRHLATASILLLQIATENYVFGYFLTMLTDGQVFVLNSGESVVFECGFHANRYNLFDYPVLWRKMQRDEETQINIMGNINEPFVSTNRFEVAFTSTTPRYKLELTVLDIAQEDSGNYTCEVRGPQSMVLGHVTHYLFVRAPTENIVLSKLNVSERGSTSPKILHFIEGTPSALRCVAFGGYPPPSLEIFVEGRDVTSDFHFFHVAVMSGRRGLRTITYRTERWTGSYVALAEDDAATLKCISTVPGLKPFTEYVRMNVDYSPKLICTATDAFLGERNVNIRCQIKSKPKLTAMFWIIDSNGTALAEGDVINGLWTLVVDRPDGFVEVQLFMRQARAEFFRKYTIVAENNVAIETTDVYLNQKFRTTLPRESATAGHVIGREASRDLSRDYVYYQNNAAAALLMKMTNCFFLDLLAYFFLNLLFHLTRWQ